MTDLADIDKVRRIVIGRELTKLHEEIIEGTAEELCINLQNRDIIKGEFAVFVSGTKKTQLLEEDTDN